MERMGVGRKKSAFVWGGYKAWKGDGRRRPGSSKDEEIDTAQTKMSHIPVRSGQPCVKLCNGLGASATRAEMKQGRQAWGDQPPTVLCPPREPWGPSGLTLSPRCRQACTEAAGTQMGSFSSPLAWGSVEARGCACVFTRTHVCGEGWVAVFLVGRSLWLPIFSLQPSQGAMGSQPTGLAASHIPNATEQIPGVLPAPCAGSSQP